MTWEWWIALAALSAWAGWEVWKNLGTWREQRRRCDWVASWERDVAKGLWEQALARVEDALREHVDDPWGYYAKGFIEYRRNHIEDARQSLDRALALDPDLSPARFLRAHLWYYACGLQEEAMSELENLIHQGREAGRAFNTLGLIHWYEGRMEESERVLKEGASKFQTPELSNSLGLLYCKQGRLEEALKMFREGLTRRPDHVEILMNLGNLHAMRMDYAEAEAVFQKCETLDGHDPLVPYWRGCVLAARQAYPEAEAQLHRAIDLQPSFAMAYYQLARVLERGGQRDRARQAYQTAVQIDPKLAEEST